MAEPTGLVPPPADPKRDLSYVYFSDGTHGPVPKSRVASALRFDKGAREGPPPPPGGIAWKATAGAGPNDNPTERDVYGRVGVGLPTESLSLDPVQSENRRIRGQKAGLTLAADLGVNLLPGVGPSAALSRQLAQGLTRVGLAGLSGAGVDMGVDAAHGRQPNPESMVNAGLTSAGGQAAGELVGLAARPTALFLTDQWLRPTRKMLKRAPNLTSDVLDMGVRVRPPGQPVAEATAVIRKSSRKTKGLVGRASSAGARVTFDEVTASARAYRDRLAKSSTNKEGVQAIDDYLNEFRTNFNAENMGDVANAHETKRTTQREVRKTYDSEGPAGNHVKEAKRMVARDMRAAINRSAERVGVRGYNASDARTSRAINVETAADRAAGLRPTLAQMWTPGIGLASGTTAGLASGDALAPVWGASGAGLGMAATNPFIQNRLALMLNSRFGLSGLRSVPQIPAQYLLPKEDGR